MLFPNSNEIYFSKSTHLLLPNYISPDSLLALFFAQVQNWSMVISFVCPSIHLSPASPLTDSLYSTNTVLYFLIAYLLRICCTYQILWSTFIGEVSFRCPNNLTVRSRITHTKAGTLLLNVLIFANFLLIRFWLVAVRILSCMIIISAYSPSSVSSTYLSS